MKISKTCTKCKENKQFDHFNKRSKSKDGLMPKCKLCCKNYITNWINNQGKDYNINRKQKYANLTVEEKETLSIKDKNKRAVETIKDKNNRNKKCRENKKRRYNTDNNYKLRESLRSRINHAIKNNQKAGSAVDDLGCSIEEFNNYIESKFEPWMNWDNWGKFNKNKDTWQLDHIEALANFNLEDREEFLKAAHYSNYQPMLAKKNLKKRNKKVNEVINE